MLGQRQPDERGIEHRPAGLVLPHVSPQFFENGDVLRQRRGIEFGGLRAKIGFGEAGNIQQAAVFAAGEGDQQISQMIGERGDQPIGRQARRRSGHRRARAFVSLRRRRWNRRDRKSSCALRQAQHLLDILDGQLFVAEAQQAIEQRQGIAHRAGAGLGDQGQGIVLGGDFFLFADFLQMGGDFPRGNAAEIVSLAARENRRQDFLRLGRGQDKFHMARRFFERFQQRVEGALTEHVDFVDDVDLEPAAGRAVLGVFDDLADVVHAGVAGGVDFDDVDVVAAGDGQAGIAFAAGLGRGGVEFLAIQSLGEDAGGAGFAGAARAAEKIGVGDPAGFDRAASAFGNVLLADEFVEVGRAIFSGEDGVGHRD